MSVLRVIYVRSNSIGGWLIRLGSWWDQWSHCGIVTPENTVINARAFHGVVEEPMDEFLARYKAHAIVEIAAPEPSRGIEWARKQLGCGYDYGAILGFIFREPFDDEVRWQCVELTECALIFAGRNRFRRPSERITVAQSYMVK
jgi:hypothetical protein